MLRDQLINKVIDSLKNKNTVLFCGAGISRDSGLPIVSDIVSYLLKLLGISKYETNLILDENGNIKIQFEYLIQSIKEICPIDKLSLLYRNGVPNDKHFLIAELLNKGLVQTVVTTNFDLLIEKALGILNPGLNLSQHFDILYTEQDLLQVDWNNNKRKIIKLHGSAHDINTMAITLSQVSSQLSPEYKTNIIQEIFSSGTHNNVLVLGYSCSDFFDINPQIESINNKFKKVYYIEHANKFKIESLDKKNILNPFKKFKDSYRCYFNTNKLIKELISNFCHKSKWEPSSTKFFDWKKSINEWYDNNEINNPSSLKNLISSNIFLQLGEYKSAKKYAIQSISQCKYSRDIAYKATVYNLYSRSLKGTGEYKQALVFLRKAIVFAKRQHDPSKVGNLSGQMGILYNFLGKYRVALTHIRYAIRIAKNSKDLEAEGYWIGQTGLIFSYLGDSKREIYSYDKALSIAIKVGDKKSEIHWLVESSSHYKSIGKNNLCRDLCRKAWNISKQIGYKHGLLISTGTVANLYKDLKQYDRALKFYTISLKIARSINSKSNIGTILGNMGIVSKKLEQFNEALNYFNRAIKIATETGNLHSLCINIGNTASVYRKLNNNLDAIIYYKKAIHLAKKLEDFKLEIWWLRYLGLSYKQLNRQILALDSYNKALVISKKIRDKTQIKYLEVKIEKTKELAYTL